MFEKEAEEYVMREDVITENDKVPFDNGYGFQTVSFEDEVKKGFRDGAEFGYNKANEWHYPSKGEYPKEYKDILICFLTEDDMKDCVRGWYEYDFENNKHIFKYLNVLGTQYLKTVIAWKEIVLPELKESK